MGQHTNQSSELLMVEPPAQNVSHGDLIPLNMFLLQLIRDILRFLMDRWLRNHEDDAEDIAMDAVLIAISKYPSYCDPRAPAEDLETLRRYAFGVAKNKARAHLGKLARKGLAIDDNTMCTDTLIESVGEPTKKQALRSILVHMKRVLSKQSYIYMILFAIKKMKQAEIAARYDTTEGRVSTCIWRARKTLRKSIEH